MARTRCFCEKCGHKVHRVVGAKLHDPCPSCGGEMRPTTRLPGGQPTGRPFTIYAQVSAEVHRFLTEQSGSISENVNRMLEEAVKAR